MLKTYGKKRQVRYGRAFNAEEEQSKALFRTLLAKQEREELSKAEDSTGGAEEKDERYIWEIEGWKAEDKENITNVVGSPGHGQREALAKSPAKSRECVKSPATVTSPAVTLETPEPAPQEPATESNDNSEKAPANYVVYRRS